MTGRGFAYPTALEAALKLMETSYVAAHAFSGADLLHGPLAMVDPEYPVVAVVPDGVGAAAMAPVLQRVRERGADLLVVGAVLFSSTCYVLGAEVTRAMPGWQVISWVVVLALPVTVPASIVIVASTSAGSNEPVSSAIASEPSARRTGTPPASPGRLETSSAVIAPPSSRWISCSAS